MNRTINFLLEYAGPVIKYRTISELLGRYDEKAEDELLAFSGTKDRLTFLKSKEKANDFNGVHGATNYHLENSLSMVLDYGIKKGIKEFDQIMSEIMIRLKRDTFPKEHVFSKFINIIIVPFLYKAGFRDEWIIDFMYQRLEILYQFTKNKVYDIYDDNNKYKGIPTPFKNRQVIKPYLYENGDFQFPLIYDIYGFSELIKESNETVKAKIETIIDYILNPKYNNFYDGYGILHNRNKHYFAMGWDVKLPEVSEKNISSKLLHRLELMAHFRNATKSSWFKEAYNIFTQYKTDQGTFIFPKEVLKERVGNWVLGNHMSLGENRRKSRAYELESTFRMLKIDKILSSHNNHI